MANTSIYTAFERMWQHVVTRLSDKSDLNHIHDEYATKEELESKADEVHTHEISDINELQAKLDGKLNAPSSVGTAGQFAVSDGNGGISWLTVTNVSEVGM